MVTIEINWGNKNGNLRVNKIMDSEILRNVMCLMQRFNTSEL